MKKKKQAFIIAFLIVLLLPVPTVINAQGEQVQLSFEAFDLDSKNELKVEINGAEIFSAATNPDCNLVWIKTTLNISEHFINGVNSLTFYNPTTSCCRIRNVEVNLDGETQYSNITTYSLQNLNSKLYSVTYIFNCFIEETVSWIVFSDPHIGKSVGTDGYNASQRLQALLLHAGVGYEMFITGDLTSGYSVEDENNDDLYSTYAILMQPYSHYEIKGNHDSNVTMYCEKIGDLNWVYRNGNTLFVGVSSINVDADEWTNNGVVYNLTTYSFLDAVVESSDYVETQHHFLFMHYQADSVWRGYQEHGSPAKMAGYIRYFDMVFHGHEGGGERVGDWYGTPTVKAAHLADGRVDRDTYLKVTLNVHTGSLTVEAANFITNVVSKIYENEMPN